MHPFSNIQIATARLSLRPLQMRDAQELFRIYSDPEFTRYWSSEPWASLAQAEELIGNDLREMAKGEHIRLGIFLNSQNMLIGTCSIFHIMQKCRRCEIGYGIAREHWRHGYMFEAVSALLKLAFEYLDMNRIEADIDPRNTASARSLEKLGFRREGRLRERWIVGDEISDSAIYGLLASDWRSGT